MHMRVFRCVCVTVCVLFVCVCVRERERERERPAAQHHSLYCALLYDAHFRMCVCFWVQQYDVQRSFTALIAPTAV